jgi:hypothetical protein
MDVDKKTWVAHGPVDGSRQLEHVMNKHHRPRLRNWKGIFHLICSGSPNISFHETWVINKLPIFVTLCSSYSEHVHHINKGGNSLPFQFPNF